MDTLRQSIFLDTDSYTISDILLSKVFGVHKVNPSAWLSTSSGWHNIVGLHERRYVEDLDFTWEQKNGGPNMEIIDSYKANGYRYDVKIPNNYSENVRFPLVVFIHGGVDYETVDSMSGTYYGNTFTNKASEDLIFAEPTKNDTDWQPEKLRDVIIDICKNLNINMNRIYLTGLSMGGRGTFICCAGLPNLFAAIAPLSPHHQPTDYSLLNIPNDIPVFLHHSINDQVSEYQLAINMRDKLIAQGNEVNFVSGTYYHSGWEYVLYGNSININWLLSKQKA